MIETLAHPLNTARLNADGTELLRGYTLLQPRVSTALPSATASLFSRLFTDTTGTDPYTNVVSDVYQDLLAEGSYHGKGIYDLAAFHCILKDRFPQAHLLSHDLIEGNHVRIAFVSDIELFDLFPRDYVSYSSRQHRWVRGDWQIADWILPTVPNGRGETVKNPLRLFNRWKVFDNLRRSLLPASCVAMLLAGWLISPTPALWSWLIAVTMFMPFLIGLTGLLTTKPNPDPKPWHDLGVSFQRCAVMVALLPHQAVLSLDAIARVAYRRLISHKLMLEWETASEAHRKSRNRRIQFVRSLMYVPIGALVVAFAIEYGARTAAHAATLYLTMWILLPLIVAWMNSETSTAPDQKVTDSDRLFLRQIARQTWRFFDTFVGPQTNWLPPDNYQAQIRVEVAPRTSPTNIGLWYLVLLAAQDMGYLTIDDAIDRLLATNKTLNKLERFEGHFLNWYDIYTAKALFPRYVSMVDSGNLLGHLWTFSEGLEEKLEAPVLDSNALRGIEDCVALIRDAAAYTGTTDAALAKRLDGISNLCHAGTIPDVSTLISRFRSLREPAAALADSARRQLPDDSPVRYWSEQIQAHTDKWNSIIDRYLIWLEILNDTPSEGLLSLGNEAHEWRRAALADNPSLRELSAGAVPGMAAFVAMKTRAESLPISDVMREWLARLADAFERSEWFAGEKLAGGERVLADCKRFADEMNMKFLYDAERKVFAIGYNVDDHRRDNSFYDLLASEARLGSFVAIARNEIPVDHWFALGRPFSMAYGQRVMLSWSGTMFEYLMPHLVQRSYDNSLLNQVMRSTVAAQIAYGKERGIPWGISEAGYSALDARQVYQYQAFGVPGLGLKRGLEDDTVIAPYATALALMVAPKSSIANLRRLAKLTPASARGDYGFYEAVDYTRQRDAEGDPGVMVYEYMAHHQGMAVRRD